MKQFLPLFAVLLSVITQSSAFFRGPDQPYVQSAFNGRYYARCVPANTLSGLEPDRKGITSIYRVEDPTDKLLNRYNGYSREGVLLAMPEHEKVAVMILFQEAQDLNQQVEFSFYMQNKLLKAYTTRDLQRLGVELRRKDGFAAVSEDNQRADIRILEIEHVRVSQSLHSSTPSIISYWAIEIKGGKKLLFDMQTGELIKD